MRCPFCAKETTMVVDKRPTPSRDMNRRRRECISCKKRFTTYEKIEGLELGVIKKDGSFESFDKAKLLIGIQKACEKRDISDEKIKMMVNKIERKVRTSRNLKLSTDRIGELVMKQLKALDKVAYIRFASVCRSFDNIKSFEKELKVLSRK